MAFKPNYNQQRAERNRLKQAKKDAKLRERDEAVTRRKTEQEPSLQCSRSLQRSQNRTRRAIRDRRRP